MSKKLLPCRYCGENPKIIHTKTPIPTTAFIKEDHEFTNCKCLHTRQISKFVTSILYSSAPPDFDKFINLYCDIWNARNEKFNPFIETKEQAE